MRLDIALVERGLARSRTQAARLIEQGRVIVDGRPARRAAQPIHSGTRLEAESEQWVSRAAHKLLGALDDSATPIPERVLDAGASTGGFTQVCLERGASQVYAVDVGHDQLAPELRADSRVRALDGVNLRDLTLHHLDDTAVQMIVGDVSFISLQLILPQLLATLSVAGVALLLVKPQFEVGRGLLGAGGVVRDENLRRAAVNAVLAAAEALGWHCDWDAPSHLPGTTGNIEHFVRLIHGEPMDRVEA